MPNSINRISIIRGEFTVSDDPNAIIVTVLGSCVAACLYDPIMRVGGMNHFLLPGEESEAVLFESVHYGVHLMDQLLRKLLEQGALRDNLKGKLFGGSSTVPNLGSIGSANAQFAKDFLVREKINFAGGSVCGERARRVEFRPSTGKATQMLIAPPTNPLDTAAPFSAHFQEKIEAF